MTILAYCIRVNGMNKRGRALSCPAPSTVPMTFRTKEAAVDYMKEHGIMDVCYTGIMVYEEDYYVRTWPLKKIQSIKLKPLDL